MSAVLHYFDLHAKGECIRMILNYAGFPFEDKRYIFEEWKSMDKVDFEFKQMPMLEIDGHKLVQSRSIAKYLLHKFNYVSADAYQNYLADSARDLTDDFTETKIDFKTRKNDPDGYKQWVRESFSYHLKQLEIRYVNNGENGFFVGNSPSFADFAVFQLLHDQFVRPLVREDMFQILECAPKLMDFYEKFLNSSETFKTYIQNRAEKRF